MTILTVHVHDITMAAPDIICVRVRDQEVVKGGYHVNGAGPEAGALYAVVSRTHPVTLATQYARISGKNKDYLWFFDTLPTAWADRAAMDNIANYPTIGGRTVTAVYRTTLPYDQGRNYTGVQEGSFAVMEHTLYLKLSGTLAAGTYTISITGNTFPSTSFTFNDKVTRCSSISATMMGHRPADGDKAAYLKLWLPLGPNEGAVDLVTAYSLTNFYVINTAGTTVYTGTITQRLAPTDTETQVASIRYPSTATAPKIATAVNDATNTITIAGHGFSTGEYKYLAGFYTAAGTQCTGTDAAQQITVVDADNFTVPSFTGTWSSTYLTTGQNGRVYDTYLANRYRTYVFHLDYSAFTPNDPTERYRVYIPGFGVSDEFQINDNVYYQTAKIAVQGIYNQAIGIALSSDIGGWDRPVALKDGVSGFEVYETTIPSTMVLENNIGGGIVTQGTEYTNWITSTRVNDFFGNFMDAGDWDWHIYRHFPSMWVVLDVAYDRMPSANRDLKFGFPNASTLFGSYTSMYDGIDALGDVIHMVLFCLEPLRRTQKVDGRVYAGMNFYSASSPTAAGGGSIYEPSWVTSQSGYVYPADHMSNFMYAACAAKMGKLLQAAGFTSLGQTWIDSAKLAWDWAQAIFADYAANGIAGTVWQAYYYTTLDVKTKSGWSDATITTHFGVVQTTANQFRCIAAACLYTAYAAQSPDTSSGPFLTILDTYGYIQQTGFYALAAWEYSRGPTGTALYRDYINYRWTYDPENTNYNEYFTGVAGYRNSSADGVPWPSSPNLLLNAAFLASSERKINSGATPAPYPEDNTNKFLKLTQAGEAYYTGANPYGVSTTTGIGPRQPTILSRDREVMAMASDDVPGFSCYMGNISWETFLPINNLQTDAPSVYTALHTIAGDPYATTGGNKLLIEPYARIMPPGSTHFRNTFVIYATETDLGRSLWGRVANNILLHCWDGNTVTTKPATRFRANCV